MNVFPASVFRASPTVTTTEDEVAPKVNVTISSRTSDGNSSALLIAMSTEEALFLANDLINRALELERKMGKQERPPAAAFERFIDSMRASGDYSPSKEAREVFAPSVVIPEDRSDFTKEEESSGC